MNAHPRPYYYLENFAVALDWLQNRYSDLLAAEERQFMGDFVALPTESAALAVRMVMRKGELFRTSKLSYGEIGCPKRAAAPLIDLGWIDPRPSVSFLSLYRLLRKAELWSALRLEGAAKSLRKTELVPLAGTAVEESRPLQEWWPQAPDEVFKVLIAPLCERLRLMFFGNFRQTWSEFVLADLGIFRYESVSLDESARAFQTRQQIEQFHAIYRCRELLEEEVPLESVLAAVPAPLPPPAAGWIEAKRAKLLFAIGQLYERAQQWEQALLAYRDSSHPQARIRTLRVLERLDRLEDAAALLLRVQREPASELEAQLCARMAPRLSRKPGWPNADAAGANANTGAGARSNGTTSARRTRRPPWETLELELPNSGHRVELAVSEHLGTPQAPVLYVENTLLNALFGLLCWEAIFAPLPGAFFHAFHAAPADLLEPDFRARRAAEFASCFARLKNNTHRDIILETFERKAGLQTPFVAWTWLTRAELELALDCIPAAHLHQLFDRLLRDVRANRSGLPDLIQLWPDERRYRLIEVKGPGDRLQDNQVRWLNFCTTRDIPVCVCKVKWTDLN